MPKEKERDYLIFFPVYNVRISKDFKSNLCIERVNIYPSSRITRIRKKLGIDKRISGLNKYCENNTLSKIISESETWGIITQRSSNINNEIIKLNRIKEDALWILASSQFFRVSRDSIYHFGLPEHERKLFSTFIVYDKFQKISLRSFKRVSPIEPYIIDGEFAAYLKRHFFPYLLKIINSNCQIDNKWKNSIRRAAIYLGKSILSKDIVLAFLYDWIAIESIIQSQEKLEKDLAATYNAFFGRAVRKDWQKTIRQLIVIRNHLLHRGDTSNLKTEHLIELDGITYNLFFNICKYIKYFPSRESINEFCKKVEAKRILNMKPPRKPNISFYRKTFLIEEINRIKKLYNWP